MKQKIKKILQNGGCFFALLGVTGFFLLKDVPLKALLSAFKTVQPIFFAAAVAAMALFLFCEGTNIRRCLNVLGSSASIWQGLQYACTGFFFSAVTPSASGGQPMQLFDMNRDHLSMSHGTLALLFELASYQVVTTGFAICGLSTQYARIRDSVGSVGFMTAVGLALNLGGLFFILTAMFSQRLSGWCVRMVTRLLKKLRVQKADLFRDRAEQMLGEYRQGAAILRRHKSLTLKTLATTTVQVLALHSIPFLIYRGLGLSDYSFWTIISLQAVLYISVSALPLPGAMGASEGGFLLLFRTLFPAGLLPAAMLLSRGVSFYLFVLLTGLVLLLRTVLKRRKVTAKAT